MKTPRFLVLICTILFASLMPRPAEARAEVSFDFFYDSLSPYGEWVQVADYGHCWRPTNVDRDWAPYADGYWAYTDAGWTWVSYEDFGGIVYHYGRWVNVEEEGWCWMPDYEWGPAWVSWRNNDDYVGWAPLPPEARWRPSVGISVWADREYDIGPSHYNFCRVRDFGAPVLRPVIINRIENVTIIRRTVNITNISYNTSYHGGPVICNGGPDYAVINQRSARHIPALKLVQEVDWKDGDRRNGDRRDRGDGDRDDRRRNFNGRAVGNQLIVTAPRVKPPADPEFLKARTRKVIAANKVSRGWNGVKNEEVRKEVKQEMQRQTRGLTPETAPARAVTAADLKVVPVKADPRAPSPVATKEQRERPEKGGRTTETAGRPAGPNVSEDGRSKTAAEATVPPGSKDRPEEKTARGKEREPQKPVAAESNLKPSAPVAESESKSKKDKASTVMPDPTKEPSIAKPKEETRKMRGSEHQTETAREREQEQIQSRQQKALTEQEKAIRQQAEVDGRQKQQREAQRPAEANAARKQQMEAQQQAEANAQRKRQMEVQQAEASAQRKQQTEAQQQQAEANAQRKRQLEAQQQQAETNALRKQQMEAQRQAEGMRQQQKEEAAAAARQRMQAEQGRAARHQAEAAAAQQKQAESARRQQNNEAAAQQQRKAMEQQRAQHERNEATDQARRSQEAQREQMRRQMEAQRQPREPQRSVAPPSSNPSEGDKDRRGKKKDD